MYAALLQILVCCLVAAGCCRTAAASGPRWTAGPAYFNPAAKGTPIGWANGSITYYVDQGALSSTVSIQKVVDMLNQAAAVWTSVPTAAISIQVGGNLNEDISGSNVTAKVPAGTGANLPSDAQPTATNRPVGVIMDYDGSVINDMYGAGASDPSNCTQNAVMTVVDNFSTAGNIQHALILLNGLCATTSDQVTLMQYEMVRAWGHVLGLDWSQVNDAAITSAQPTPNALAGWPIMHPTEVLCAGSVSACMPNETTLRLDDIAGLNRLYPVTSSNINSFSGKKLTAANTLAVQGTIQFPSGQGMQGVNVVLTPVINGVPQVQYSVSTVSGARFHANAGNPVTGPTDAYGNLLNYFGTDDPTMEGYFDLSGVPLPSGVTTSDYQLTFEAVNPNYYNVTIDGTEWNEPSSVLHSVGPYVVGQVAPSGTMPVLTLAQLSAGSATTETVTVSDAARGTADNDGTEAAPLAVEPNGEWLGRTTGYGHTGWFQFAVAANRVLTVEAQSLDENGLPSMNKAEMLAGLWGSTDALGTLPDVASTQALNGAAIGLSTLSVQTNSTGAIRLAFADQRGDGRPDYRYVGRVLYAASVSPARIPLGGGSITIRGMGFRPNSQVLVNGVAANITSVSPTEITAVAPAVSNFSGLVPVTVQDPLTLGSASILDGLSYDNYGSDELNVVSAPSGTVSEGVPVPFTVRVVAADGLTPAANVAVTFSVATGAATLGCGAATCQVVTNSSGLASLSITPTSTQSTHVQAALNNGSYVQAVFAANAPPAINAVGSQLYVAIGAIVNWQPTALVLSGLTPQGGVPVQWSAGAGATVGTSSTTTAANGQATTNVTVGPLASGGTATITACEAQSPTTCTQFTANAVHVELAVLRPISGAGQTLAAGSTPAPVVLQVTDAAGHMMAGATVSFYEQLTAWQPACPVGGRCKAPQVLSTASVTATSDVNGLVTLTPLTGNGAATFLNIAAAVGQQASLVFTIEQYP